MKKFLPFILLLLSPNVVLAQQGNQVVPVGGSVSASSLGGPSGTIFNAVSGYGAVGDGSTANATAFANLATAVNAYTQHPSNGQGLTDLPTVYFPPGTYNYASGLNFTVPVIIRCEQGAVLNYTGSAHAMDWGPTNLTGSTYQTTYFLIGCTLKGGASMTEGIYVNDGVLYPRIFDSRFINFGNATSTVWQIFFNGASVGIDDPEVARNLFFNNDAVGRNGVKVASGNGIATNQLRFHDNSMLCAQAPGVTNTNGTHSCPAVAVGVFTDGVASLLMGNNIAWYQPDIQIGSNSLGSVIENNTFESNSNISTVSAPVIGFGDSAGGNCVACAIDGIRIVNNHANMHNQDFSTTSPFLGPTTASALIENSRITDLELLQVNNTIPTVVMNNTVGQPGNSFSNVMYSTNGTIPYLPVTLINTSGSNITDPWKGFGINGDGAGGTTEAMLCGAVNVANSPCLYRVENSSTNGNPLSRMVLDTANDTQAYPNRGGFVQHTSGASGGTKIGDWEANDVQVLTSPTAGNIGTHTTFLHQGGMEDTGTTFSASGCSISAHSGGAAVGQYTSGTSGTCTVSITPGSTAAHGWSCDAHDITTPADIQGQTSASTTTIPVISGTTISGDVVNFKCEAY